MRAAKSRTLIRSTSSQQLFEAALGVVQNQKYTLVLLNNENLQLGFISGKTGISWGQEYLAEVVPSGDGATLTVLCGSHDDAPKALMDGWKGGKAGDKFVAAVESVLDGVTTAPVTPTASFALGEDGPQPL